ncbi:MAG TPA: 30S ribosome-binding factor RbfA [Spirochaetia bacterium]|nr:30S ribosome-binding factor RbfA [Spirochaetia bacterium]
MQEIRKKKIESLLREKISAMVLMGELKDPRINELVTVMDVSIAKDLRDAKIYVSIMGVEETKKQILETLNHAAGFVQKLLGRRIRLRYTPRLTFFRDDSIEKGFRIDRLLKDLET